MAVLHSSQPNPQRKQKKRKMYAIKQIKICAEYRDMLPRPRLDLSGTPGLRPIGLSPGSWQTSLGLGSMSRYSAQILICITMHCVQCTLEKQCTANHVISTPYNPYLVIKCVFPFHSARLTAIGDGSHFLTFWEVFHYTWWSPQIRFVTSHFRGCKEHTSFCGAVCIRN